MWFLLTALLIIGKVSVGRLEKGNGYWMAVCPWWLSVYQGWTTSQKQSSTSTSVEEVSNSEQQS